MYLTRSKQFNRGGIGENVVSRSNRVGIIRRPFWFDLKIMFYIHFAIGMAANNDVSYIVVYTSEFQSRWFARSIFVEKVLRMWDQVTGVSH